MKTHKFNVEDAEKYGVNKAIILEHLRFHQQANEGNPDLEFDGKPHAFIKPATIKKMYPYFSYPSIRRWLQELEEEGVLESRKPKSSNGNHLKFYHVFDPIDQNDQSSDQTDQSIDQNDQSMNDQTDQSIDQNDHSSNITNVDLLPNESINEVGTGTADTSNGNGYSQEVKDIANHLLEAIVEWDPQHKYAHNPPKLTSWYKWIDQAIRLEKRTPEQLHTLIDCIYRRGLGSFWAGNILSGKKLRLQFDKAKADIKKDLIRKKRQPQKKKTYEERDRENREFLERFLNESEPGSE